MKISKISLLFIFLCTVSRSWADVVLPVGNAPDPVEFPHFPSRMHALVWRNWPVVEAERLANVLGTTPEIVGEIAASMGLTPQDPVSADDRNRIYITLIRRNWHLLPYEQLLTLLGMTPEQLAHALREDDFLFIKLGSLKPQCDPIRYTPPNDETKKRCTEIAQFIEKNFGDELKLPEEKRFHFIRELSQIETANRKVKSKTNERFSPRYIYSYFALYGDPLMNPQLDPFPDGLLQKLSDLGVDGVWMHTVLRQLTPSDRYHEFGTDCETRLKTLSAIVQRAKRHNIGVYLYVNEPRAMPADFFSKHPDIKGVSEGDYHTLCTSVPEVRQWLTDSLAYVFANVPDLAGVFTITGSENLTNCASHGNHTQCPRCKKRTAGEIIAEVNAAIEAGVHRSAPDAKVIVWDWGWRDEWVDEIIAKLPPKVWFMSVSEWSKPIQRGGINTTVGEYSISAAGPGPRASKHWAIAKKRGLKTVAKMQINCTWELSAVPYLPVLDLIAEHGHNLFSLDVNGLMLSWTLGGYPSPNLRLVQQFDSDPPPAKDAALDAVARSYFDPNGVPLARQAWTLFSDAFREYPYHVSVLYLGPQQYGPSNLLYSLPTGYAATMVGFPYDDVDGWRGPYPSDIFADQFAKVADGWANGIPVLKKAVECALPDRKDEVQAQINFAEAAQLHFASVANQVRFTMIRNALLDKTNPPTPQKRDELLTAMKKIIRSEIEIAKQLFALTRKDSRIGFEASNHYYYLPIDLMEKVIDCQYILDNVSVLYP